MPPTVCLSESIKNPSARVLKTLQSRPGATAAQREALESGCFETAVQRSAACLAGSLVPADRMDQACMS